jgi:AraC-like DNA-binding protein
MVCGRCKMVVKSELEKLGLHVLTVDLGEVEILDTITKETEQEIESRLHLIGFELIDDKKSKIIDKVKTLIIDLVHTQNNNININLSEYLSNQLQLDYTFLSTLFSEVEGLTIEKYFIHQKIEKVKELIMYDEMSLSEIAFMLNYSSVAHLSNQFKKSTGFSPSYFKNLKQKKRKHLDEV